MNLLLLKVNVEFSRNEGFVNFKNLQPKLLTLVLDHLCVRSHESLLEDLLAQNFIKILAQTYQILEAFIIINKLDTQSQDLRQVSESELLEPIASFHEGPCYHFFFAEHAVCVFLIALQLSQEDMHFALLHLVDVAKVNEQLMGLVKWKSHIAEMLHKSG